VLEGGREGRCHGLGGKGAGRVVASYGRLPLREALGNPGRRGK